MSDKLPSIFKGLADQVIDLTNDLPLDPKNRAANIRAIIDLKTQIAAVIVNNPEYVAEVRNITNGFKELKKLSDSYFSELIDGFNAKEDLYKAVLESNIDLTVDKLLGSELKANFSNEIRKSLNSTVTGNGKRSDMVKAIRELIEGTGKEPPFLNRYITQTTNDSLQIFSREYNNTVATDLNLQFYFYAGTRISDTRPFCVARHGRYFKKSVVEGWASMGDWQGRYYGTTKVTIFSYCGGYNCRHELYPVSKAQYTVAEKKGLAGLR